jgi:hypothetical protein
MGTAYDTEHINPNMSAPITNPMLAEYIFPVMRAPLSMMTATNMPSR